MLKLTLPKGTFCKTLECARNFHIEYESTSCMICNNFRLLTIALRQSISMFRICLSTVTMNKFCVEKSIAAFISEWLYAIWKHCLSVKMRTKRITQTLTDIYLPKLLFSQRISELQNLLNKLNNFNVYILKHLMIVITV